MKKKILKEEAENIMSIYWQMLREIEVHTKQEDILKVRLVSDAYTLLNRIGVTSSRPEWENKKETLEEVVKEIKELEAKYGEIGYSFLSENIDPLDNLDGAQIVRDILKSTPETVEKFRKIKPVPFEK